MRGRAIVMVLLTTGFVVTPVIRAPAATASINTSFAALAAQFFQTGTGPFVEGWQGSTVTLGPSPIAAGLTVDWGIAEACNGSYFADFALDDHRGNTVKGGGCGSGPPTQFSVPVSAASGAYASAVGHVASLTFSVTPFSPGLALVSNVSPDSILVGSLKLQI